MAAGKGFSVDPQALRDVSAQLNSVTNEISAHPARDLDCAPSAFGSTRLANATSGFSDRLQRCIEALTADATEMAKRLDKSAGCYENSDLETRSLLERAAHPYLECDGPDA